MGCAASDVEPVGRVVVAAGEAGSVEDAPELGLVFAGQRRASPEAQ